MVNPLPKWAMLRYALLWNKFETKEFGYEEASDILKEKNGNASMLLSRLRRNGWLIEKLNTSDSRKRIYQLKSPEAATRGMTEVE